ncbi:envelope stress response membrane protein PspB [Sphingomonas adhaesiva]|uniref:envelope stress response membrane protein PspB n=1 Tax=Sphingomonas adhaesiva TaxID=28212 RepID=UPI002FF8DA35
MDIVPFVAIISLFIALPWLILHYVTKWKTAPKMTGEDERLLDEMHNLARRLEDRVNTVERLVAADNPDFRPGLADYRSQPDYRLDAPTQQRRN